MSKHCQHITGLHRIVLSNAESQALYVFVRGVLAAAPNLTVMQAIRMYETEFQLEDFNAKSAKERYYRLRRMAIKDAKVFANEKNQSKAPGNRKNGHVFGKSMGTAATP